MRGLGKGISGMTFGAFGTCLSILYDFILVCGCAVLGCLFSPYCLQLPKYVESCFDIILHMLTAPFGLCQSMRVCMLALFCCVLKRVSFIYLFSLARTWLFSTKCMICMTVCACIYSVFNCK